MAVSRYCAQANLAKQGPQTDLNRQGASNAPSYLYPNLAVDHEYPQFRRLGDQLGAIFAPTFIGAVVVVLMGLGRLTLVSADSVDQRIANPINIAVVHGRMQRQGHCFAGDALGVGVFALAMALVVE